MPKAPKTPQPLSRQQESIQEAPFWREKHLGDSWREIAQRFRVPKSTLSRRYKGGKSRVACGGHNTRLSKEEEKGLLNIID